MVYHRGDRVEVSVDVTNTGDRYGKEVVQLYIMPQIETDAILRPVLELRGFEKVGLKSGGDQDGALYPGSARLFLL